MNISDFTIYTVPSQKREIVQLVAFDTKITITIEASYNMHNTQSLAIGFVLWK
jgi:hypothetical protein